MKLCNKVDKRVLKERIAKSNEARTTISFYKYAKIGNPDLFRDYLYLHLDEVGVLGRIYVAKEGINAQISVPTSHLDAFKAVLNDIVFLRNNRLNIAVEDDGKSFYKLTIKARPKILADGLNDESFDVTNVGNHLAAKDFNEMLTKPNTVVIDMRNHYEHEVGHFENAVLPDVDNFRDSLPFIEETYLKNNAAQNILMYCTGGIRCEKASAWFKHLGYENVYQLEGGIIKYANDAHEQNLEVKFHGKNFVFDERLGEKISNEILAKCHQCGEACDTHTNCKNEACNLLFIQCEKCAEKYKGCCDEECKSIAAMPLEEQRAWRKGKNFGHNVFKKGRKLKDSKITH